MGVGTPNLKTWVEINKRAVAHNFKIFKSLLSKKTELWAVVKSNAYGHGLLDFSKTVDELGVDGFCVDSVLEAKTLRDNLIRKPILVLGPTLPGLFAEALQNDVIITISNQESLNAWLKSKYKPAFHLKIDTGMHRQGFYVEDLSKIIQKFRNSRSRRGSPKAAKFEIRNFLQGVYTHFSSAKDINYPTYTDWQFENFKKAIGMLEKAGYKNIKKHAAATSAAMINKKYRLDAVRIGIGLYGLWPSKELQIQLSDKISLKPVLSWQSIISEIKNLKVGDYVGYDLAEKIAKPTKMAVVPIGYWHGFSRALSGIGEVLVSGKKARVLGKVSMDLIVIDVTGISCKVGDSVSIIGQQKNNNIGASDLAIKSGTTHYEIVTRINPLIKRVIK